jgi:hypothetical protein
MGPHAPPPSGGPAFPPGVSIPPTEGWSIAGLLTAVAGLLPLAVPFAVIGFAQHGASRRSRRLAVIALLVCLAWAAAVGAAVGTLPKARAFVNVWVRGEPVYALPVGTCFVSWRDEPQVHVVSCSDSHDGEVYASQVFAGAFPGVRTLLAETGSWCEQEYARRVALPYRDELGDYRLWIPTAGSFHAGQRVLVCAATTPEDVRTSVVKPAR